MDFKEQVKNIIGLSEDDRKPLIKWFDAFEKELKKLKGSYSKVKPTDMLQLYYDDVDPKEAAKQLKESVLDEGKMKEFFMDIHDELEKAMDKKWYREMQSSNGAQGLDNIISNTHKQLYGKGDPDPKDIADAIIAKYGRNHKEYMKLSLDMMRRNESIDEAKDYRVELEKRHIKALTIIRHIDKILGKQGKWTDSFGEYVTKDMPDGVDTSIDAGWSYHQNRGRGEWFFTIEPRDVVKYSYTGNAKIDFAEKSGRMKIGEFTKFISTIWAKLHQKGLSSERPMGECVSFDEYHNLDEDSHWVLSFEFNKPEYTSTLGRQIQKDLDKKFKSYSGSGSGGAGWDISFNGSKKELEKAKKYVEKEYKKFIDYKQTQFVMDESVELGEATKWKMGDGKPRGGSHIENIKFWDMTKDKLQYIIKDAGEAMKANPKARKATSGRGNWADQVNDAHTVLGWRKKNGIKESIERTWRRWEEVSDDDACNIHKRCGRKNNKHLLVNPLRDYEKDELEGAAEYTKGNDNKVEKKAQKVHEDAAVNNVGGGEVAGIAPGEDPPVKKKRTKFAGCDVFEVSPDIYYKCVQGKKKFEHWKRYFDRESGDGAEIYEFAYKYPRKAIIVQNKITQEMVYLRHSRK